jgi:hypothetical protein
MDPDRAADDGFGPGRRRRLATRAIRATSLGPPGLTPGLQRTGFLMRTLIGLAVGLTVAGCSVVGIRSGTEEPHYIVVETIGSIEIRRYDPRIAIETDVAGDEMAARSAGFRRLAGYIFGANQGGGKIAMTAPVAQAPAGGATIAMTAPVAADRGAGGQWRIRFFAPAGYTLATMPHPNDSAVRIAMVPAETVAVLRFSGSSSPAAMAERQRALLQGLQATAWRPDGAPVAWFYDPPWTIPAFRRNEAAVAVTRPPA